MVANNLIDTNFLVSDVVLAGNTIDLVMTTAVHGSSTDPELWVVNCQVDLLTPAVAGAEFDLLLQGITTQPTFNGPQSATYINQPAAITRITMTLATLVIFTGQALQIVINNWSSSNATAKATNNSLLKTTGYYMNRII